MPLCNDVLVAPCKNINRIDHDVYYCKIETKKPPFFLVQPYYCAADQTARYISKGIQSHRIDLSRERACYFPQVLPTDKKTDDLIDSTSGVLNFMKMTNLE